MSSLTTMTHALNWADWFVIAVLVLSSLVGVVRGFVRECLSLMVWIAAVVISISFSDQFALVLADYISTGSLRFVMAFAALFIATLILGNLLGYILGVMVKSVGLSGPDRLLGVAFGLARGVIIVMLIVVFLPHIVPVQGDPWWQRSTLIPVFAGLESEANQVYRQVAGWIEKQFF